MPNTQYVYLPLGAILYFAVSWLFPWDIIQFDSSISVSYFFDVLFTASIFFLFKKKDIFGRLNKTKTFIRIIVIALLGFLCVILTKSMQLLAPFRYVENIAIQILILAPLVEEFVFRGALFELGERSKLNSKLNLGINSVLFSLSHAPALWYLGKEFHSFVYFQIVYTLLLGWVCAKSREKSKGVMEPIILHFVFNLMFYLAIKNYGL